MIIKDQNNPIWEMHINFINNEFSYFEFLVIDPDSSISFDISKEDALKISKFLESKE